MRKGRERGNEGREGRGGIRGGKRGREEERMKGEKRSARNRGWPSDRGSTAESKKFSEANYNKTVQTHFIRLTSAIHLFHLPQTVPPLKSSTHVAQHVPPHVRSPTLSAPCSVWRDVSALGTQSSTQPQGNASTSVIAQVI